MRAVALPFALVLSLASLPVGATEPTEPPPAAAETTEPAPPAAPEQHTVVRGTLPRDLAGRWMAVGWIELPGGKARTTTAFWEIGRESDGLALTVRFAGLPSAQQKGLDEANSAEQPWRPAPRDITRLAAAWDALPPSEPRLVSVQSEIVARDGFDQSFSNDAKTRDAAWVVRQSEKYHPSAAPAIQTVNVYAVLEPREGGYFGNFTTATIAAVPLPIPITLSGTFQMYRLDAGAASRGFLGHLIDLLGGCGRR